MPAEAVAFTKVLVIVDPELLVFPVMPTVALDVHANVALATFEVKLRVIFPPEQIVFEGETVAVTVGIVYDGNGSCGDFGTNQILTYKIQNMNPITGTTGTTFTLTLDRALHTFDYLPGGSYARLYVYPSGMTELYDFVTPAPFWQTDTLNFESPCDVSNRENTLIWNMNIPWTGSPAVLS